MVLYIFQSTIDKNMKLRKQELRMYIRFLRHAQHKQSQGQEQEAYSVTLRTFSDAFFFLHGLKMLIVRNVNASSVPNLTQRCMIINYMNQQSFMVKMLENILKKAGKH